MEEPLKVALVTFRSSSGKTGDVMAGGSGRGIMVANETSRGEEVAPVAFSAMKLTVVVPSERLMNVSAQFPELSAVVVATVKLFEITKAGDEVPTKVIVVVENG